MKRAVFCVVVGLVSWALPPADTQGCDAPRSPIQSAYQNPSQSRRYLVVKNDTDEKLTIKVKYRTQNIKDQWKWYPVDPEKSDEALTFELDPGEETSLLDDDFRINASRVRIWAVFEDGTESGEYKDQDLWLVPEEHKDGTHCYYAPKMESFTFTFSP